MTGLDYVLIGFFAINFIFWTIFLLYQFDVIDIPEEIAKEGRTYYLVTIDKDGNIVVLQNEGIVDGTLTGVTKK